MLQMLKDQDITIKVRQSFMYMILMVSQSLDIMTKESFIKHSLKQSQKQYLKVLTLEFQITFQHLLKPEVSMLQLIPILIVLNFIMMPMCLMQMPINKRWSMLDILRMATTMKKEMLKFIFQLVVIELNYITMVHQINNFHKKPRKSWVFS